MSFSAISPPVSVEAKRDLAQTNLVTLGRFFFAAAMVASGIQQIAIKDFVRLVPKLPAWVPWIPFWSCAVGAVLILSGAAILFRKGARSALLVLGILLLSCLVFQHLPFAAANPLAGYVWTNPLKILALCGGLVALAGMQQTSTEGPRSASGPPQGKWRNLDRLLMGVFLLVCGLQHFAYADFVTTLVPDYILGHRFWTYFTGVALCCGGVGLLRAKTARLAALLSGIMILLWIALLHIPRALAALSDPRETSAIFEALALSGVAFLIAGTVRRTESSD